MKLRLLMPLMLLLLGSAWGTETVALRVVSVRDSPVTETSSRSIRDGLEELPGIQTVSGQESSDYSLLVVIGRDNYLTLVTLRRGGLAKDKFPHGGRKKDRTVNGHGLGSPEPITSSGDPTLEELNRESMAHFPDFDTDDKVIRKWVVGLQRPAETVLEIIAQVRTSVVNKRMPENPRGVEKPHSIKGPPLTR